MDATSKFWNFISLFQVDVYQEIKPSKVHAKDTKVAGTVSV